jgi:hypothetical protein
MAQISDNPEDNYERIGSYLVDHKSLKKDV